MMTAHGGAPTNDPVEVFSASERDTLVRVCDTLIPVLRAEGDDDGTLFSLAASQLDVPAAMEAAISLLDKPQQAQFRDLLRLLERPVFAAVLIGKARPFGRLSPRERERLLWAMATHPVPLVRAGFQALKRLATFLYYAMPADGGTSPVWPAIGYVPSSNPAAVPAALTVTPVREPGTMECDVCVIGSGAGGSVVAAELAAAGRHVFVLEAGSDRQAPDFDQHELAGMQDLYLESGMTATRNLDVAILAGATLGGGTTVNWQTCLRTPHPVREEWAVLSGCRHFIDDSFTRSLDAVMARLHVNEVESQVNPSNAMLRDGCRALGYRCSTIARNAFGCDPTQCGYCVFGCRHGGKQSTGVTYLADAQRLGTTTILAGCRVERVEMAKGRVTGVTATSIDRATGRRHAVRVHARVVVVAAGAIHSPAILLRSGLQHPALGRNLFLHPTSAVAGRYADPIRTWDGPPQTVLCDEFAWLDGPYGFRLETPPAHPGLLALATPWLDARQHRRDMQSASHAAAIIVLARDRSGGRITLRRTGNPVIDYNIGRRERAYLQRGIAEAARVHLAAGAYEVAGLHTRGYRLSGRNLPSAAVDEFCSRLARAAVHRNWSTVFSAHQMGTCRMGTDAHTAVCGPTGQVHGVPGLYVADGSAFPASSGVNPMITIMALAHHISASVRADPALG